ncbi:CoA transferase [Alphaproteobacteria bacterium LMG 31809]|uniref:CoA transferase n=2 Tax=Govanella unica TaxID=2975056 RepID=A0A9X3TWF5_9PROT|nr:CaiB/BaiF CoA-transferase family protein [Govania unica]MDA5192893.1 CoA transferase [Govania unica]
MQSSEALPLAGLKVIEFTHMVMGPSIGVILADLGAEVTKVEPLGGDATRRLLGAGSGYFPTFNRNKRSICLDLKSVDGLGVAKKLCAGADIVVENFRAGTMDKLGLGYAALSAENERLIYCSAKGFLPGPYENRTALDEVAQMMGGLAYMTGPVGRPLRAGSSVIDITGGMFGVIGVLAALEQRHGTGKGKYVTCSLYETTAFLVSQHMAQLAATGKPAQPMPSRVSAWAIYDLFETSDDERVFVGVVSDSQWVTFCKAFDLGELGDNADYKANNARVLARDVIIPRVQAIFKAMTKAELLAKIESIGLPFAPVTKPEELFEDKHLNESGGLVDLTIPGGAKTKLPALPISMDGARFGSTLDVPHIGEHSREMLVELGLDEAEIERLLAAGAVG